MQSQEDLFDRYLEYEQVISKISTVLLNNIPSAVNIGLEYVIQLSGACRIYIFQNFYDDENDLCFRQIHEICAEGIPPEIDNPDLQRLSYEKTGFERWRDILGKNEIIIGNIEDFPQTEQAILAPQGILSILVLPILLQNHWFGLIGFDYTKAKKAWSKRDLLLLRTASELFGAYFENAQKSEVLRELSQKLENQNQTLKNAFHELHLKNQLVERQYQETKQLNKQLTTQKEEISVQAEELTQINKSLHLAHKQIQKIHESLVASINYAQKIQNAIIPSEELFNQHIGQENYFIFFKPKDIVSGDFYYLNAKPNVLILAVIDCTGHGVPGAFMTVIGNNILNHIINEYQIYIPNQILNLIPVLLKKSLQDSANVKDGMDLNIITLYKDNNQFKKIEFAGAMNPLYYIKNQCFNEIKGDKISIEAVCQKEKKYTKNNDNFEYTLHKISIDHPTYIYLATDGYADQFGGKSNKKFMSKRLKRLLFDNHQKTMAEQQKILSKQISNWRDEGNEEQIDDITIFGVKL